MANRKKATKKSAETAPSRTAAPSNSPKADADVHQADRSQIVVHTRHKDFGPVVTRVARGPARLKAHGGRAAKAQSAGSKEEK